MTLGGIQGGYVARWVEDSVELVKDTAERVVVCAKRILSSLKGREVLRDSEEILAWFEASWYHQRNEKTGHVGGNKGDCRGDWQERLGDREEAWLVEEVRRVGRQQDAGKARCNSANSGRN
jgi:hypothetical protein